MTLAELIAAYKTDPDSGFRKLRYQVRLHHERLCRRIEQDHGGVQIAELRARQMLRWHEEWTGSGVAMAHGLMTMLRTLLSFGVVFLEDDECARVSGILHNMRFPMAPRRDKRITAGQVVVFRQVAHAMGLHSLALAQAFQFEAMFRQRDVIGEWVPHAEPGVSEIHSRGEKWLRGLRWSGVDDSLILRHVTSKRGKLIEIDLHLLPMVMEELGRFGGASPSGGPVIVSEADDLPYAAHEFRRLWRKAARAAGIPDDVYNMDSRAGAISEATDAGADLELVRHAATHSNITTTQGYSRGGAEKVAEVARRRVAHRSRVA